MSISMGWTVDDSFFPWWNPEVFQEFFCPGMAMFDKEDFA